MRFRACLLLTLAVCGFAQDPAKSTLSAKSVTVPAAIDHNRIIVEGGVTLPDGSTQRVRVWVDNGNPELNLSRRLATALGLAVSCDEHECSSPPPKELSIGGMSIALADAKQAKIPLKPVNAASVLASGINAEINLPSSILRHYDVLIDFPERKLSIGTPGTVQFRGPSGKAQINPENGLIQVPSQIERKKYNLALDLGSNFSFISAELFDGLIAKHSDWPQMTGAVGSANMWGLDDEPKWKLMRLERVQYGPLFLANIPVASFPPDRMDYFSKRAGIATAGLIGSNALLNYRVGLDYAHSTVYFEFGRMFNFPDFDVIGLILRPEDDGRYTILGVADIDGKPSMSQGPGGVQPGDSLIAVDSTPVRAATMGQVWSMLGGLPGQERKLTIERQGKQFTVNAPVQHFLAELSDDPKGKKKK